MTLAQLIPLLLQASFALMVFALGLSASPRDASYLFRHPGQFALAAIVVVPVAIELAGNYFGTDSHMPVGAVAWIVARTVIAPLAVGLIVRQVAPAVRCGIHSSRPRIRARRSTPSVFVTVSTRNSGVFADKSITASSLRKPSERRCR